MRQGKYFVDITQDEIPPTKLAHSIANMSDLTFSLIKKNQTNKKNPQKKTNTKKP